MKIKGYNIQGHEMEAEYNKETIRKTDSVNLSKRNKELEDEVSRLKAENLAYQKQSSSISKVTAEFNICSHKLDQSRNTLETTFDQMNWKYYHDRLYNLYGKFLVKYNLKMG